MEIKIIIQGNRFEINRFFKLKEGALMLEDFENKISKRMGVSFGVTSINTETGMSIHDKPYYKYEFSARFNPKPTKK